MKISPNNFVEKLKEYFDKTPKEQVLKDWRKTVEYDSSETTVDEFIKLLNSREVTFSNKYGEI